MHKLGRGTDLTEDKIEELTKLLRDGLPEYSATKIMGLTSYVNYKRRGREEIKRREQGKDPKPACDIYIKYVREVEKAQEYIKQQIVRDFATPGMVSKKEVRTKKNKKGEVIETMEIVTESPKPWNQKAWLLTKLYPEEFGDKVTTVNTHTHKIEWKNEFKDAIDKDGMTTKEVEVILQDKELFDDFMSWYKKEKQES